MRPPNRATCLHPPDGPPEALGAPRPIGRRRTLGVPLTPTDRLDSCLRRNDEGLGVAEALDRSPPRSGGRCHVVTGGADRALSP